VLKLVPHNEGHLTTLHGVRRGRHLLKLPPARRFDERLRYLEVILSGERPLLLTERPDHSDGIGGLAFRGCHNLHERHAHGLRTHPKRLMAIETIEAARAKKFKQTQCSSERRIMGDNHRLTHKEEPIPSLHSDTTSINRRDSVDIDDGSPVLEASQNIFGHPLGVQLILIDVGEAEIEAPFTRHGANVEGAPLALAGADELFDGKQVLP